MLKALQSAIGSLGFMNGSLYLLGRVMQAISGGRCHLIRYFVVAQPVPSPFHPVCRPSARDRIFEATGRDDVVATFPRPSAVIQGRFAKGYVCLAATSKDEFAGFLWYARNGYDEDEVHCRFVLGEPSRTVWDFDVHVEPQMRMGRTFARLWDAANDRLGSQGIAWSISRISAFNRQSLQSHGRLGIRHLHTMTFLCFGSLQLGLLSCGPYLSLAWSESSRPRVTIFPPRD